MRAGAVLLLYVMCSDKGFACISTPQSQGDPAWMVLGPSRNKDRSETAAQRTLGSGNQLPYLPLEEPAGQSGVIITIC